MQPEPMRRPKTQEELDAEAKQAYQRRVAVDREDLNSRWDLYQRIKFDAPPKLMPPEAAQVLQDFHAYFKDQGFRDLEQIAIEGFDKEIHQEAQPVKQFVEELQRELQSTSRFTGFFRRGFGKIRDALRKCKVSIELPDLETIAREAVAGSCKLLRQWRERAEARQQAVFSIHKTGGKDILHIGSSLYGSVFITMPGLLEEEIRLLLSHLKEMVSGFIASDSILAVIDGDHQTLNYQAIFEKNIVVRSAKADCDRFDANLDTILHRQPITPENTGLHLGLPANSQELQKVFEMGKKERDLDTTSPDWADWSGVLPDWQRSAKRNGFDVHTNASATQILDSLTKDENVIIIVAHGDHDSIYLPAPPPEGSKLTEDQVKARRYEITANKPVVYLFCCETAVVSDLKSFAQVLLDSGAAAVIAPQIKIDADDGSIKFFESLVQKGGNGHENSLTKLQAAMQQTNYREMEVFLG